MIDTPTIPETGAAAHWRAARMRRAPRHRGMSYTGLQHQAHFPLVSAPHACALKALELDLASLRASSAPAGIREFGSSRAEGKRALASSRTSVP